MGTGGLGQSTIYRDIKIGETKVILAIILRRRGSTITRIIFIKAIVKVFVALINCGIIY